MIKRILIALFVLGVAGGSAAADDNGSSSKTYVMDQEFTSPNGFTYKYSGPVVNGLPNGDGVAEYEGERYVGCFVKGVRKGNGILKTKDGSNSYEGAFFNDGYQNGKLTFLEDGSYYIGTFSNNALQNGEYYSPDGVLLATVVNGEFLQE